MESDRRLTLLKAHINRMPPLSPTVTKVLTICNDIDASPADINRVISVDPVLMGKLLKLINSAYYGLAQKVTSLVRAIIMLGINTVKNMLLSTAILSNLGNKKNFNALEMVEFWKHSLAVGVTAKLIAKKHHVPPDQLESFFIAGLLHDIGKIPMNNKFSDEYYQALDLSEENHQALYISEMELFGTDHSTVGKLIADNWHLGDEISDTIFRHHAAADYVGDYKTTVFVVTLADYLVNTLGIGFSGNAYPGEIDPVVLNFLGSQLDITYDNLKGVVKEITIEIERAQVFLSLSA